MRRSLFTNETERAKFLNHLAGGTLELLRTQQGLADHANYHEFCRLLGRLKTNYQLSELVRWDAIELPLLFADACVALLVAAQGRGESSCWVRSLMGLQQLATNATASLCAPEHASGAVLECLRIVSSRTLARR